MNRNQRSISVLILVCGIIIGLMISSRLEMNPVVNSGGFQNEGARTVEQGNFTQAVEKVAEAIGPAVVSIHVEVKRKYNIQRRFSSPFHDDFFDRFFEDFFGNLPEYERRQHGLGSGVIIDQRGYILTNEHVVGEADKINVTLPDGREFEGKLVGTDSRSDLAVVKIEAGKLPVAKLGNSDDIRIGQWVVAIGNPFGQLIANPEPTVTVGVVSALNRSLPQGRRQDRNYTGLIQTDAAINPGNSGGPLVNLKGEVIGINVAIFSTSGGYQGIGFAIPVTTAKRIITSLIKGEDVEYGWIGVSIQDIDQSLADYFDLDSTQGALVSKVLEGGPAEKVGIQEGDVILEIEGEKVKNVSHLVNLVGQTPVGESIRIKVLRDQKTLLVDLKTGKRPLFDEEGQVLVDDEKDDRDADNTWRGMSFQNIPESLADRLRRGDADGVVINGVEEDSPAGDAGLRKGDIITSVNNKPVKDAEEFRLEAIKCQGDCLLRTNRGYVVIKEKQE